MVTLTRQVQLPPNPLTLSLLLQRSMNRADSPNPPPNAELAALFPGHPKRPVNLFNAELAALFPAAPQTAGYLIRDRYILQLFSVTSV